MGCYPLFACQDWSKLHLDLKELGDDLVTLTLVADPFGAYDVEYLEQSFDVVTPFKEHFVADLSRPIGDIASKHHRYYARRAFRDLEVKRCADPESHLDEWLDLYAALIKRHRITGIRAFSKDAFAKQLAVPGMVYFRALSQGTTVGANLVYVQGEVAYTHLSAFSARGYELRAAYAIRWCVIEYLINRVRWLNLGSYAGLGNVDDKGLKQFKGGWATGIRTAYLCGRIFDHGKYVELARARSIPVTDYFPAYRQGEFG
jgi:hypothetical protein